MNLKNWEIEAVTGVAISGATVQAYVASDTHPNPGSPVASTSTNLSGMWELTGLTDGVTYDIKVTAGSRVKWYKGGTKHNIGHLYDDTTPDPNRNLLANGGQDSWVERGTGLITLPTADPGTPNTADGWTTYMGSGDSGTAQLDTVGVASNSKGSIQINYTRSGGQLTHYRDLPDVVWQGLKGLTVSISAQVQNFIASSELRVIIDDGVGITTGPVVSGLNAYLTASASRVISASATRVRVGVQTNRVDTGAKRIYIDNIMMDITSVAPVYAPEPDDMTLIATQARTVIVETPPSGDNYTLAGAINAFAHRITEIIGVGVDWKDAIPRTLTGLVADLASNVATLNATITAGLALKVAKAGDTVTGLLNFTGAAGVNITGSQGLVNTGAAGSFFGGIGNHLFQGSGNVGINNSGGLNVAPQVVVSGAGTNTFGNAGGSVFSGSGGLVVSGSSGFAVTAGNALITNTLNAGLLQQGGVNVQNLLMAHATLADNATNAANATNASQLGGIAAALYALLPSVGSYAGDNTASRGIVLGFQPSYVLITCPDADPGAGITAYLCHLMSTTVAQNFQIQIFPGTSQASSAVMSVSALAATGFIIGNLDANNVSGITYRYIAFR
jgi:hypothetical protein